MTTSAPDPTDKVTSIDGHPLPSRKRRIKEFLELSKELYAHTGEGEAWPNVFRALRSVFGMAHALIEDVMSLRADVEMLKRRAGSTCGARRADVPGKCEREVDASGLHDGQHQAGTLTWED